MYKSPRELQRERLSAGLQTQNKDKKPYLVRGMPDTVLYLTPHQASLRDDLIPNFKPMGWDD